MKKIVYLLAMLCMASMGFAQSYDYDRIVAEPHAIKPWFSVSVNEQEEVLPSVASYGHLTLLEQETDVGDMVLQFTQTGDHPASLQVTMILKEGMDKQFRKNNPIQFFVEENGETVVSVHNEKEYTLSYLIKMVWKDPQGKTHQKYIGRLY